MSVADDRYDEGYWERGEGSNYRRYGDDPGWPTTLDVMAAMPLPGTGAPLRSLEGRGGMLLEIGCAKGWFVHHAVASGWNAYGVDVSEWALGHPAPNTTGRLALAAAWDTGWPDATFDVVCSWEVLEHLQRDEIEATLAEMRRVLKRGGLLINRICLPGLDDHDETHVSVFPRGMWEAALDRHGFWQHLYPETTLDAAFADRDWCGRFFVSSRKG